MSVQEIKKNSIIVKRYIASIEKRIICQTDHDIRAFAISLASEIFSMIKEGDYYTSLDCSFDEKKYRYIIDGADEKDDLFYIDIFSAVNNPPLRGDAKIFFDWFTGNKKPKN